MAWGRRGRSNARLTDNYLDEGTSSTSAVQCDLGSGSAIGDKGKVVYENIQNIPPLPKTYIKSPAKLKRKRGDEDPSEPSSAAKRIDFDDPSAA
ncbi:hypothetical protein SUGI_0481830 [Cryptomeria japonica]|nr:hypothetical protein SUGI_0481830 [Cryptomeria japonica]